MGETCSGPTPVNNLFNRYGDHKLIFLQLTYHLESTGGTMPRPGGRVFEESKWHRINLPKFSELRRKSAIRRSGLMAFS